MTPHLVFELSDNLHVMMGDFEPLSENIFVRRPLDSANLPLILIFGWMGGNIRYVKKYAELYEGHMVVITTGVTSDFIHAALAGHRTQLSSLAPLVELLAAEGCLRKGRRTFIHLFSNGGCLRFWSLQQHLDATQSKKIDIIGLVVDSAPTGSNTVRLTDGVTAFTASIQSPLVRWLARPLVAIALILLVSLTKLFGLRPWHLKASDALITDNHAPLLFIFSKADKLVGYKGIEHVINDFHAKGLQVEKLAFDDSEHVKHLMKYPNEYKSAVKRLLNKDGGRVVDKKAT